MKGTAPVPVFTTVTWLLIPLSVGAVFELAPGCVAIVRIQPLVIVPVSPVPSSITYKDQVPFGVLPLKTDSVAP